MKRSSVYLFALLCILGGLVACGPTKSVQELNPGVTFMGKDEVTAFYAGAECEGPNAIVKYYENGKASVYVKKIQKDIPGSWKVEDDGMVALMTKGHVNKFYTSIEGPTFYNIDGTNVKFTKR